MLSMNQFFINLKLRLDDLWVEGRIALQAQKLLPWTQKFYLIFHRMRELGESREAVKKKKPLVTLDKNLTFMQTPGSGSDPRARTG